MRALNPMDLFFDINKDIIFLIVSIKKNLQFY